MELSDVKVGAIVELPGGARGRVAYVTRRLQQFEVSTSDGLQTFTYDEKAAGPFVLVAPPTDEAPAPVAAHTHMFAALRPVELAGVGRVSAKLCLECKHVTGLVEVPFDAPAGTDWESAAMDALRRIE